MPTAFVLSQSYVETKVGRLYLAGQNTSGQLGNENYTTITTLTTPNTLTNLVKSVSLGRNNVFTIDKNDKLYVCGQNDRGQLGIGNSSPKDAFVQPNGFTNTQVFQVTGGEGHAVLLNKDSALYSSGRGNEYQHGSGNNASINTFEKYYGPSDITKVTAGSYFNIILRNGELYGTGWNPYGNLGTNDIVTKNVYTRIGNVSNYIDVSAGNEFTIALRADGTIWSTGRGNQGQLGLGPSQTLKSTFTQIGTGSDWKAIDTSDQTVVALKEDGTVWGWGLNNSGQLGLGDVNGRNTPTQIGSSTDWLKIKAGSVNVAGIKKNGTLWVSGSNTYGESGLGETANTNNQFVQLTGPFGRVIDVDCFSRNIAVIAVPL